MWPCWTCQRRMTWADVLARSAAAGKVSRRSSRRSPDLGRRPRYAIVLDGASGRRVLSVVHGHDECASPACRPDGEREAAQDEAGHGDGGPSAGGPEHGRGGGADGTADEVAGHVGGVE